MDVENENIVKTIFGESFPEEWKDNTEFLLYLSELSSSGMDKLAKEPANVVEESSLILEQTQELAFNNYKMFIETAECTKRIHEDFGIIEQRLSSLVEKIPSFIDQCKLFSKQSQTIMMSRKTNSTIQAKHSQLIEILELPQLMDTCVRNGYYEEALELAAYIKTLERKHSSIFIIANIIQDIHDSMSFMVSQLLSQLRTNIQLPACLKIISYLRRMDIFTEAELRIEFLQVRDSWFSGVLKSIPTDDAYHHLTKTIEASRVHLFDIITQYRAIFSDDEQVMLLPSHAQGSEASLFSSWVLHKIDEFLKTLEEDLQRGINNRLDSIIGHCMYFGLSFSRIGADFRMLLVPIFQRAVLNAVKKDVAAATQKFEENMLSYTLSSSSSALLMPSTMSVTPVQDQLHPPMSLIIFSPVAHYCNSLLSAFNKLHLCAPLAATVQMTRCVQESMENVALTIHQFYRAEEAMTSALEKEVLTKFCTQFCFELVPYIDKCLQAIFPPTALAAVLGISVPELLKLNNLGRLDQDRIIGPLKSLLPLEEVAPEASPPEMSHHEEEEAPIADKNEAAATYLDRKELRKLFESDSDSSTKATNNANADDVQVSCDEGIDKDIALD